MTPTSVKSLLSRTQATCGGLLEISALKNLQASRTSVAVRWRQMLHNPCMQDPPAARHHGCRVEPTTPGPVDLQQKEALHLIHLHRD